MSSRCPRCKYPVTIHHRHCPVCRKELTGHLYTHSCETDAGGSTGSGTGVEGGGRIHYAGFWRRLSAAIVDSIVILAVAAVLKYFLEPRGVPYPSFTAIFLAAAFYVLFYSPLWLASRYRATPGKILFGVIVVYDNGRGLPFSRALVRETGKYVSLVLLGCGFWMIAFSSKKQGLHDLLALTVAVRRSDSGIYDRSNIRNPAATRSRIRVATLIICIFLAGTLLPLAYLGTLPQKSVTPQFFAARSLSSAGDSLAESTHPEYSLQMYNTAIELQPNDTSIQVKKLYVLDRLGRINEAQAELEQMITLYPNETTPIILKGDFALQEGNFDEALACYDKAIAADPKNAKLWVKKGDAHLLMAVTGMHEMRTMYRNLTNTSGRPAQWQDAAPVDAFKTTKPYQDAVNEYNKAIELDPMTSVVISGRILSSTGNLVDTYQGILQDM